MTQQHACIAYYKTHEITLEAPNKQIDVRAKACYFTEVEKQQEIEDWGLQQR
jgi:hypothetical protein